MNKTHNQNGQALIELIIFLPLMITLYSVIGGFAGAINGSINQQKATRSYFYYRVQHNSAIPGAKYGADYLNWRQFGMFYVGWKQKFSGGTTTPVMPCYRVSIPFKGAETEKCDDSYTDDKTLWVRVGTVYGVCGATYVTNDKYAYLAPDGGFVSVEKVFDESSCTIAQ